VAIVLYGEEYWRNVLDLDALVQAGTIAAGMPALPQSLRSEDGFRPSKKNTVPVSRWREGRASPLPVAYLKSGLYTQDETPLDLKLVRLVSYQADGSPSAALS